MSTLQDSQGERRDKAFLEDIISRMPSRIPMGQHHDNSLPSTGYIENFRLTEMADKPGEWQISADVFMDDQAGIDFDAGGFSYSATEIAKESHGESLGALYIPYPLYRDDSLLEEILNYDPSLNAGRWIKKNADPNTVTIIVAFVVLAATPLWTKVFDTLVWPFLERVTKEYFKGRLKDKPFDFAAIVRDADGKNVNVIFVPDRLRTAETFTKDLIKGGLGNVIEYLHRDLQAKAKGVSLIKLYFDAQKGYYQIFWVQYRDGTISNIL